MTERKLSLSDLMTMLEAGNFYEYEVRKGYSGRGMNGKVCTGIVIENDDLPRLYFAIGWAGGYAEAEPDSDEAKTDWISFLNCTRIDNMGRSAMIVYWPSWDIEG